MQVELNQSNNGQITLRANNFVYDEVSDSLQVIDADALDKELELHCVATEENREKKIVQMRNRVLSQVKGIERRKRGRRDSICSVRSVNSGVGAVRSRSEMDEDDDESDSKKKNTRLLPQSLLPTFKQK